MENKKILIIDDEPELVEMLKVRLEANKFSVISAYDGYSALDLARAENPDLIILDLMLPKMDGYKVCRMLKFDEKYKDIPIIFLTARDSEEDRKVAKEVGADGYIAKPFDAAGLINKINELLGV